jgi:hypothetical protein
MHVLFQSSLSFPLTLFKSQLLQVDALDVLCWKDTFFIFDEQTVIKF